MTGTDDRVREEPMTERDGGWWPRGPVRWEPPGRTLLEEVLLVVAVVLSLVAGILAAVVAVLAASVLAQSLRGPDAVTGVGLQLVVWGLLVVLVLSLPFVLVAAVVALSEYGETRSVRRRLRRTARPPVAGTAREHSDRGVADERPRTGGSDGSPNDDRREPDRRDDDSEE